jgi:hypothetical protein
VTDMAVSPPFVPDPRDRFDIVDSCFSDHTRNLDRILVTASARHVMLSLRNASRSLMALILHLPIQGAHILEDEMATATDTAKAAKHQQSHRQAFVQRIHGVRYQVKDVARSRLLAS